MSNTFEIQLERLNDYRFQVDFGLDESSPLVMDEPPPLGSGSGPNPSSLLAAAVGDCLSASLIFCLTRSRTEVDSVKTKVIGTYRRNERARLRIGSLDVTLEVSAPGSNPKKLSKCLEMFEDFCVVTASVRKGINVSVKVIDTTGQQLFASTDA